MRREVCPFPSPRAGKTLGASGTLPVILPTTRAAPVGTRPVGTFSRVKTTGLETPAGCGGALDHITSLVLGGGRTGVASF